MRKWLIPIIAILLWGRINLSFGQTVIQMEHINGVDKVPCKVNGLDLKFIFDSGASDVSISLIEESFMLKNGYLDSTDILEKTYSTTATGEISVGTRINIKTIVIGGVTLYNVEAQVRNDIKGDLLFGQTAMTKLGAFQINPITHTLTIINAPNNTIQPNISNNYSPNGSDYPTNNNNSTHTQIIFPLFEDYIGQTRASIIENDIGDEKINISTDKAIGWATSDDLYALKYLCKFDDDGLCNYLILMTFSDDLSSRIEGAIMQTCTLYRSNDNTGLLIYYRDGYYISFTKSGGLFIISNTVPKK